MASIRMYVSTYYLCLVSLYLMKTQMHSNVFAQKDLEV